MQKKFRSDLSEKYLENFFQKFILMVILKGKLRRSISEIFFHFVLEKIFLDKIF